MAIVLYARKSVERENSISCETQLEYCRSKIKLDELGEKVIPIVDNVALNENKNTVRNPDKHSLRYFVFSKNQPFAPPQFLSNSGLNA